MEITLTWALFWKVVLFVAGIYDAEKYGSQTAKIRRKKTSGVQSRWFLVKAWLIDVAVLGYVIANYPTDYTLLFVRVLPLFTIGYLYYVVWQFYPYKRRGLNGFKRPSLIEFIIDSCRPKGKL